MAVVKNKKILKKTQLSNLSINCDSLLYINNLLAKSLQEKFSPQITGYVDQVTGSIIKATMTNVQIGEICILRNRNIDLEAEVIGFRNTQAVLSPIGDLYGIAAGDKVIPTGRVQQVPVGNALLGRVINALGEAYDDSGPIECNLTYPLYNNAPSPMSRKLIRDPLPLGIKAIDTLLTMGQGQRMGIFAAAGVGKSKLISSVIHGTVADVVVLALIGERGREVRDFIEQDLGPEGMKHTVIVVSTSDQTAMQRLKGALVATTISEYFRDQGKKVLLLMDSVTRFARALREVGLAAGEPPARRGFPPSVFANLPKLMERAGNNEKGSISALYTVLVEGDDMTEPIADETRSILDGHIVLSRKLAAKNHYPAIDILESVSRTMDNVISPKHLEASRKLRELMALYQEIELLLKIGEYKTGSDEKTDLAVQKHEAIEQFLKQKMKDVVKFEDAIQQLIEAVG